MLAYMVNFRCHPGIVSAADAHEANPGLDSLVHFTTVRRRWQPFALQITVKAEAESAAAWRLQMRARPVAGCDDDNRTRIWSSWRPARRNRKSCARLLWLQQSQVRHAGPHYGPSLSRWLCRSKNLISFFRLLSPATQFTCPIAASWLSAIGVMASDFVISAKWTEWMAEILFSFDVCQCVCARAADRVNQTSLKWLKLRTSNLTWMFPGKSGHDPLKIFPKRSVARVTWPLNFWALNANSSKTVKATDFKFDVHVSRQSPDMTSWKICRKGSVCKKIHLAEICSLTSTFLVDHTLLLADVRTCKS